MLLTLAIAPASALLEVPIQQLYELTKAVGSSYAWFELQCPMCCAALFVV